MIIKYVCIEDFEIPFCDEYGGTTEKYSKVKKGSQWNLDGTNTLCGADLKLTNEANFIEISNERLEKYFAEMIDEATVFSDEDGYPTVVILPKSTPEDKIMSEALKCFSKYMTEEEDYPDSYFLDDKYSEIGINRVMYEENMTDVATNVEEDTLYKVWQVEINQYPY